MTTQEPSSSSPSSSALQRGRACVSCRRRKMRCDGKRPVCTQCARQGRSEDCEFTDGQGRSRTQILEENIARLEARIHELEHPEEITQSITLFDPYSRASSSAASSSVSDVEGSTQSLILESQHTLTGPGAASSSVRQRGTSPQTGLVLSVQVSGPSGEGADAWWSSDEPPLPISQQLVDIFLPHASEFGFFLHLRRFRDNALQSLPFGHHSRPSPAVLSAVYLWGIHISRAEHLVVHESIFLSRALSQTAHTLSSNHPHRVLHALQAEVLITTYFFRKGRFLEAKYHLSAAVALALSCGLNRTRSSEPQTDTISLVGDIGYEQPMAADSIGEGENINGFWTTFILDKCLSVALGSYSMFDVGALGAQIYSPRPLNIADYENVQLPALRLSYAPIQGFLNETPENTEGELSAFAAHVKAAYLLERAHVLAGKWKPTMSPADIDSFYAEFLFLDTFIQQFRNALPPINQADTDISITRALLVTHTLAHVAIIQLHRVFAHTNVESNQKSLDAACAATALLGKVNYRDFVYMSPIMSTLWMAICHIYIREIGRLRAFRAGWAPSVPTPGEDVYRNSLQNTMTAMATFAQTCPMTKYQSDRIEETYRALA